MLRVRRLPWLWGLVSLAACDGGLRVDREPKDPCTASLVTLRVEVVDARGAAVPEALVTATNEQTGRSITSTTGERGITTAVNEDIGEGTVRLVATAGSKVSSTARVSWTCDACHCTPDPGEVRLQLNP